MFASLKESRGVCVCRGRVPESMERKNLFLSDKVSEIFSSDYDTLDKLSNDNHILNTLSNDQKK